MMTKKETKIKKKKLLKTSISIKELIEKGEVTEHENLDIKPEKSDKNS
jgi:hypothetical protein